MQVASLPEGVAALPADIHRARSHMLAGEYGQALEIHKKAAGMLKGFIDSIPRSDTARRSKWQIELDELLREAALAGSVYEELKSMPPKPPKVRGREVSSS
mmetsp:Transcript_42016/g.111973  ORF Transcript_42016/g.111973 Transcript_42016/m.111973 type:complete len:101 (+) Transcript_42016:147-449(+)